MSDKHKNPCLVKWVSNDVIFAYADKNPGIKPFLQEIAAILLNEDKGNARRKKKKPTPFSNEFGIYLDDYIRSTKPHQLNHTTDMVVGLSPKHLLLVEIKLNSKNTENISFSDLKAKYQSSRNILNTTNDFSFCKEMILIISDKNFEQNFSKLRRICNNDPNYIPQTINKFYLSYFK